MNATKVTHLVSDERLGDLLCNALEGGSNYWYMIDSFNYPEGKSKDNMPLQFRHLELPFKGGSLTISCTEDTSIKPAVLGYHAIRRGIRRMAKLYPRHYADFINEDDDAITGDVFLQCCLFGEVIFS